MQKSKLNEFIRNPKKSLIVLSIPVIVSALVETLYTNVDAIFVGRISADALAAITFAWPFYFMLVALSLGLNAGISSRISRFLGEKNKKQAENTMMHGLIISLILSLIIILFCTPLLRFFLSLSGASGTVLKMSMQYMFIILMSVVFLFVSYAITSIFSAQGDTKTAMKIDIYSLVLNIILAPILIFAFHLGIRGAALATAAALLYALILAVYYLHKVSYLRFNIKSFTYSFSIIKEIISVGFPSTLMMLIVSFYVIFLNKAMIHFSVNHVAVFGIISRLESIAVLPIYGLSVGAMTLAGMFYGAKKINLVKEISWYAIKISIALSVVVGGVFFLIPKLFLWLFTTDAVLIALGVPFLRLDVFTFPFMAAMMIIGRILQAMGYGFPGLMINIIRVFLVAVPLAYLFVFVLGMGYLSVVIAMILGGAISSGIGFLWLARIINAREAH